MSASHYPSSTAARRGLYSLCVAFLTPLAVLLDHRRGNAAPGRFAERLGRTRARAASSVWVHAVSMGEVQAAAPLVRALLARYPDRALVMTTTTATGARRVRELFGEQVQHAYLPLDLPRAVRRFLDAVQPQLGIVLETELWPNLYAECARRGVPLVLASARLSQRSVQRYRWLNRVFGGLLVETLSVARIGAQSQLDRERFIAIGAPADRVAVIGNLKFDVSLPEHVLEQGRVLRESLGGSRPIWVAGSTHEGEEALLLEAHQALRARVSDALLVLVPRHPQRFEAVATDLDRRGVQFARRSRQEMPTREHAILLVDTMGELLQFYAAADVAYVGGTLIPLGGHNLLEPAALGLPVLCGPHTFNAPDVAAQLSAAGALLVVNDAASLTLALQRLMAEADARAAMGARGRETIEQNRGACDRLMEQIALLLRN